MAEEERMSHDDVRSLARMADLELSDDRIDQLVTTLSSYLVSLDRLRQIDAGACEPPAITYESEAES